MKIYILPVDKALQPSSTWFLYPLNHNDDYGMEQDFLKYLSGNRDLVTQNPQEADYHYLSVFWSRWFINHDSGRKDRDLLQLLVNRAILDDSKTFTICQGSCGTMVDVGRTVVFYSSRNTENGIDIPLICKEHKLPSTLPDKKYIASFVGNLDTHPLRREMAECFKNVPNTYIFHGNKGVDFFVEKILESYITLCPRGFAGSSYRLFEVMQLGGVPLIIGDLDIRPFKKYINWDDFSFFVKSPKQAVKIVNDCRKDQLLKMGKLCAKLWKENLTYGKWCGYVIKELTDL